MSHKTRDFENIRNPAFFFIDQQHEYCNVITLYVTGFTNRAEGTQQKNLAHRIIFCIFALVKTCMNQTLFEY